MLSQYGIILKTENKMGKRLKIIIAIILLLVISFSSSILILINNNKTIYGDNNAPIKIVEYTNFECPDCVHLHENISKRLKYYIENSIVNYEIKFVEIPNFDYGSYIFMKMKNINNIENISTIISILGKNANVPKDLLSTNIFNHVFRKIYKFNDKEIIDNNILVVPTIYINGEKYTHAITEDEFVEIIEEELKVMTD